MMLAEVACSGELPNRRSSDGYVRHLGELLVDGRPLDAHGPKDLGEFHAQPSHQRVRGRRSDDHGQECSFADGENELAPSDMDEIGVPVAKVRGWLDANVRWAKAEIVIGLLAVSIGVTFFDTQTCAMTLAPALMTLGAYLALAGHRSHLYDAMIGGQADSLGLAVPLSRRADLPW